jgi:Raf kinase inhibitor-like YbhB/YbcL family protein
MKELTIKSPAFEANGQILKRYTCDEDNINPPLTIEGTPKETRSLALIIDDPDAPNGTFNHWVVWNIPPSKTQIAEHSVPGTEGLNGAKEPGYTGPCPPSGTHRYFFKVYALDTQLNLGSKTTKHDLEKAMENHILAKGEMVALYKR